MTGTTLGLLIILCVWVKPIHVTVPSSMQWASMDINGEKEWNLQNHWSVSSFLVLELNGAPTKPTQLLYLSLCYYRLLHDQTVLPCLEAETWWKYWFIFDISITFDIYSTTTASALALANIWNWLNPITSPFEKCVGMGKVYNHVLYQYKSGVEVNKKESFYEI